MNSSQGDAGNMVFDPIQGPQRNCREADPQPITSFAPSLSPYGRRKKIRSLGVRSTEGLTLPPSEDKEGICYGY